MIWAASCPKVKPDPGDGPGFYLENRLDPFAMDYIKQHECRTCWALYSTLQLRHVPDRQVEAFGKNRLAHMRLFAYRANVFTSQRLNLGFLYSEMAHGDFFVSRIVQGKTRKN